MLGKLYGVRSQARLAREGLNKMTVNSKRSFRFLKKSVEKRCSHQRVLNSSGLLACRPDVSRARAKCFGLARSLGDLRSTPQTKHGAFKAPSGSLSCLAQSMQSTDWQVLCSPACQCSPGRDLSSGSDTKAPLFSTSMELNEFCVTLSLHPGLNPGMF